MSHFYTELSQEELFERCLQGDEKAWEWVYNYVLSIACWPRWNIRARAEDIAQTIVLFLLEEGLAKVEKPSSFKSFIKRVAISKILDSYKQKEYKHEISGIEIEADDSSRINSTAPNSQEHLNPKNVVLSKDLIHILNKELMQLPLYCQKVLPHYFYMKLGLIESYKELAEKLGDSIGVISSRVSRCLKKLMHSKAIKDYLRS